MKKVLSTSIKILYLSYSSVVIGGLIVLCIQLALSDHGFDKSPNFYDSNPEWTQSWFFSTNQFFLWFLITSCLMFIALWCLDYCRYKKNNKLNPSL